MYIRLQVKDDLDKLEAHFPTRARRVSEASSKTDALPSPPIEVELVKRITLGRGEEEQITIATVDPQSETAFNQQMAKATHKYVDLAPYHAQTRGVSRKHARLNAEGIRIYITDLGSTNGTYVNNKHLPPNTDYPIKDGDEIRLGFMTLLFTVVGVP